MYFNLESNLYRKDCFYWSFLLVKNGRFVSEEENLNFVDDFLSREYSWHCEQCEFDACNECLTFRATIPDHPHPLQITDARDTYPQYGGSWQCDICRRNYQPNGADDTGKPYHCAQCEYDVCSNCITSRIGNRFYHGKNLQLFIII